jgi:dienelactone hydrolase
MRPHTSSRFLLSLLALAVTAAAAEPDQVACTTGIFRKDKADFIAVTKTDKGYSYTFSDGRVGGIGGASSIACTPDGLLVGQEHWPRVAVVETDTHFPSGGVLLAGRLMAPPGADARTPLVVYAQGSETTGWIDRARDPYQMVGRGIAVFVYDKRGTGLSKGEYTQNFPRLADDLVAASAEAKRLAAERYGRFGLIGLSQGGWIVPLAAPRAKAEFIGVGYGLVEDIAEEDADQVAKELRERGDGEDVVAKGKIATDITASIARSGYRNGLDELADFQQRYGKEPWFAHIKGAFTGVLLGMPVADLRARGIPQFDKLDIDWSLDSMQIVDRVTVPQLWAFADEDRQAPAARTVQRLSVLRQRGRDIALVFFPDTEHGMYNYVQAPDGTRRHTRIAPGFYDLMADWAKGAVQASYGSAYRK